MAVRQHISQRVSIVGWGSVSPLGCNAESTWQNVLAGRSGISALTSADLGHHSLQSVRKLSVLKPLRQLTMR